MQSGKPLTSPDDLGAWCDNNIKTTIRRRTMQAAHLFEINKYNVMELFAVHTRIMEIEKADESLDNVKTTTERGIKTMIDDIPWAVGADGELIYTKNMPLLAHLDNMSAEARDDEVLLIGSGRTAPTLADDFPRQLPPPRREKASVITNTDTELP
jgi:hypothetical protein